MNVKSYLKSAVALAVLSGAAVSANANNISMDFMTIAAGDTFSNVIQKNIGAFEDKFIFNIDAPTFAGGSVSNLSIKIPGVNLFNVSGLTAQLYKSDNTLVFNLDDNPDSTADTKVGSGLFAPGGYYFTVGGTADGTLGGQYVFAVTTAPVPEPESYAMLLAGLGVMGAIAVRRKSKKQD